MVDQFLQHISSSQILTEYIVNNNNNNNNNNNFINESLYRISGHPEVFTAIIITIIIIIIISLMNTT